MKKYTFSDVLVTTIVQESSYSFDIREENGVVVESLTVKVYPEKGCFFVLTEYKSGKKGIKNGFIDSLSAHKKAIILISQEIARLRDLYNPNQYEE